MTIDFLELSGHKLSCGVILKDGVPVGVWEEQPDGTFVAKLDGGEVIRGIDLPDMKQQVINRLGISKYPTKADIIARNAARNAARQQKDDTTPDDGSSPHEHPSSKP